MRRVELSDLSRFRAQLMGMAMLFVMFFHISIPKTYLLHGLVRCGNVGVDMFLFLSGIGLWYSWTGKPSLKHFFRRRYARIYPVWLIMVCLFYIPDYLQNGATQRTPDLLNLILNIVVNWSFWRIDDLTFWFIPAIMMMYTFAPLYMKLIQRWPSYRWLPVVAMVWAVMVQYYPPVHDSVGHVEIFWSRIPIFLLGINCGQWVMEKRSLEGASLVWIVLLFAMSLAMCIQFEDHWRGRFPLFLERMVYIPLSITAMLLLTQLFRSAPHWLLSALKFVGGISLEIYLVHAHFVLKHLNTYHLGYCLKALLLIAISIPLAWLLSKAVAWVPGVKNGK